MFKCKIELMLSHFTGATCLIFCRPDVATLSLNSEAIYENVAGICLVGSSKVGEDHLMLKGTPRALLRSDGQSQGEGPPMLSTQGYRSKWICNPSTPKSIQKTVTKMTTKKRFCLALFTCCTIFYAFISAGGIPGNGAPSASS